MVIMLQVIKEYNTESFKLPITRTALIRYYNDDLKERKVVGAPPTIPQAPLNTMRLHIKVLQLSKKGQASGRLIKPNWQQRPHALNMKGSTAIGLSRRGHPVRSELTSIHSE